MIKTTLIGLLIFLSLAAEIDIKADVDKPSKFINSGGIVNTRHNMTQRTPGGEVASVTMNAYRNDYGEVCVYCHTPHGANTDLIDAPLWNRTFLGNTYETYDALNTSTLNGTVTQPGVNSLTCLSCHDGTLAVDSIVNMPGSGRYSVASKTAQTDSFLNEWTNEFGPDASTHMAMDDVNINNGCLACHDSGNLILGSGATDFRAFAISTDLTNDHPVGITLPVNLVGIDFQVTTGVRPGMTFYDTDGDSRADKNEIRFYDTGDGPEVECASCHDPHGVSAAGAGGQFNPSFLRVLNTGSSVCLSCHIK